MILLKLNMMEETNGDRKNIKKPTINGNTKKYPAMFLFCVKVNLRLFFMYIDIRKSS